MSNLHKESVAVPGAPGHAKTNPDDIIRKRWLRIARYSSYQIQEIHRTEKANWLMFEAAEASGRRPTGPHWQGSAAHIMRRFDDVLGSYWPRGATNEWMESQIRRFWEHFYPIYRPIWDRYDAAWDKMPRDKGYYPDIQVIHDVDRVIVLEAWPFPPRTTTVKSSDGELNRLKDHQDLLHENEDKE